MPTRCALCLDCRDGELAYVSVNGNQCWTQRFWANQESAQCGEVGAWDMDQSVRVNCFSRAVSGRLTVRVYANLSDDTTDESFAIDNVAVTHITGVPGNAGYSAFEIIFYIITAMNACM